MELQDAEFSALITAAVTLLTSGLGMNVQITDSKPAMDSALNFLMGLWDNASLYQPETETGAEQVARLYPTIGE